MTRYTCSHPSHGSDFPSFPIWSALLSHRHDYHWPGYEHFQIQEVISKDNQDSKDHPISQMELSSDDTIVKISDDGKYTCEGRLKGIHDSDGISTGCSQIFRSNGGEVDKKYLCVEQGCSKEYKTVCSSMLLI